MAGPGLLSRKEVLLVSAILKGAMILVQEIHKVDLLSFMND